MVLVSRQIYINHEEEDNLTFDLLKSEYSSCVVNRKKILPTFNDGSHVCEAFPVRSSSTDTCTTAGSAVDELEREFEKSVIIGFPHSYKTQHVLDLLEIGSVFAEPDTIADGALSVLIKQEAERPKAFLNGDDDLFSTYVTPYQEAARGDKSKAVIGSRVTKPPSGSSQKRKNKTTPSSEVDSGPLASIVYCDGNDRGLPDLFYAHDPIKYHMYSGNCSCALRCSDFFNRELQKHFKAGHFHEEFETEEAAIAAYWRVMDASPATADVGRPNYKELQYMAKLEALWGLDGITTRKCPENHRIYRVKAMHSPYKLPKRNCQQPQADVTSTVPFTRLDTVPTVSLTNKSIDKSGRQAVGNDIDTPGVTLEDLNVLRHKVADLEGRFGCVETMFDVQVSRARALGFGPFMNENPFHPFESSQPSHLDGTTTNWADFMSSQSSMSGTSLTTSKTMSTGPTSIVDFDQDNFIDPKLLDNQDNDRLSRSQL